MRDTMKTKLTVLFAIAILVLIPLIGDAEATKGAIVSNPESYDFDSRDGGSVTFTVENDGSSFTIDVTVINLNTGETIGTLDGVTVAATGETEVTVKMEDFNDVGTYPIKVVLEVVSGTDNLDYHDFTAEIVVSQNILDNWITYALIIVVIIVIIVFVYLKVRDSPKNKTEMTFEELEAQRKAEMAGKAEKKKSAKESAPVTERQKYLAEKKKK